VKKSSFSAALWNLEMVCMSRDLKRSQFSTDAPITDTYFVCNAIIGDYSEEDNPLHWLI